ncbi:activating signal cointegrator 1 complex subunit 3 [Hyalella azteca]|uniref:Activating signal cointegrator 1 complex subunit 3 n=1 Tax=Hyalella azteca TaxID=294128 RepID=A0A8B7NXH4_HYAAZ|nr:activating signal cointegrator 1 complex subunit 3 [Hyalella azteca]
MGDRWWVQCVGRCAGAGVPCWWWYVVLVCRVLVLVCRAGGGMSCWCWCAVLVLMCRAGAGVPCWCWYVVLVCRVLVLVCRAGAGEGRGPVLEVIVCVCEAGEGRGPVLEVIVCVCEAGEGRGPVLEVIVCVCEAGEGRGPVLEVIVCVCEAGEGRGPVLEVIVSRTNFISHHTQRKLRIVGLSTAVANARDLADWLGIKNVGLFNFRPSVRPVPLEVHIAGFPGKHYCPRMATMNKPAFKAIRQHSPDKPVLVFVSSRRQTRLTAIDLMGFVVTEDNPKQWLHMPEHELDQLISTVKDENLRLCLSFGVGIHHAGLVDKDRRLVEELFVNRKIQILVTTATLAWGVNFPAHLVIIKGTEYFDGKTGRYVDFPITDVLQMMGRAGRPQFDDQGVAVILVHDQKKHFYKKFLYEPFPVESHLLEVLPDHLNAEIVAGTVSSKQEALDYLTWTYFFRRLVQNPSYYGLQDDEESSSGGCNPTNRINQFLSDVVDKAISELEDSYCVQLGEDNRSVEATTLGKISSFYYLSHKTIQLFKETLTSDISLEKLLLLLTLAYEYAELPVRHNEDNLNEQLAKQCPLPVNACTFDSPHTKTFLLLQAYMTRLPLPSVDYLTDTKSVLDQSLRILQAMLDMAASAGWLATALLTQLLMQMITQARWGTDCTLLTLPYITPAILPAFTHPKTRAAILSLPELEHCIASITGGERRTAGALTTMLGDQLSATQIDTIAQVTDGGN